MYGTSFIKLNGKKYYTFNSFLCSRAKPKDYNEKQDEFSRAIYYFSKAFNGCKFKFNGKFFTLYLDNSRKDNPKDLVWILNHLTVFHGPDNKVWGVKIKFLRKDCKDKRYV